MLMVLLGCAIVAVASRSQAGRAALNVADYKLRSAWWSLAGKPEFDPAQTGSVVGAVRDAQGQPIAAALVLVATADGRVFSAHSDDRGHYRIDGVPPGRYVPMAAAWGYDEQNGPAVQVRGGQQLPDVDFALAAHVPSPAQPTDLRVGRPQQAASNFPEPLVATRIPFTFTLDGLTIDTGQIYLPARPASEPLPLLFIVYPSRPLNWDAASVGLTRDGFTVLAVGPDGDRGLDMAGHSRDLRAAMQLWVEGKLPVAPPDDNWLLLSGSFGSLIVFPAWQDLPARPPRVVDIGGVGDAFLGVQALYSQELEIPPPYDTAVAALGRPDRDPAFFYQFSPALFADHLPPMFVVHMLNDPVIPHNQATALIDALEAAGVPHDTLLYEDTTHYLDAYNPTPATRMVFERVLDYAYSGNDAADQ